MTVTEGGGRRAITAKLRDMYFRTLMTSYLIWPAVQIVNFRLMPIQLQLVSSSSGVLSNRPEKKEANDYLAVRLLRQYRLDGLSLPCQRL